MRVKELSKPTGVPGKFEVIYDALVSDVVAAEREVHEEFLEYKETKEFFRVKIRDAIRVVQRVSGTYPVNLETESEELEILPLLENRMRRWLKRDLVSVKFVQLSDICLLKIISQPSVVRNEAVQTIFDLRVIGDECDCVRLGRESHEHMFCSYCRTIGENVDLFISDLDPYSMLMVDIEIINSEAARFIADLREKKRIEPPMSPTWHISKTKYDTWGSEEECGWLDRVPGT